MSSKLVRGTFVLTIGMVLSKVLGLLYVVPFDAIVGEKGFQLYQYAYVPYTIFISIATAGVPLAVSKFIAKYNALGEYEVGRKLFRSGLKVMMATGILAFILLYLLAPVFAKVSDSPDFTVGDVTTVIRAVSFALILIPFMSLIRGFFQGHESMGPTAVSQVVEQLVRIVVLLGGAFFVLKVMDGSLVTAISIATFAAFIGAIGSLAVLIWYWIKRKPSLDKLLEEDKGTLNISLKDTYKEIIIYAVPFVFVGIAMPLFQWIDSLTFTRAMTDIGMREESGHAIGILNVSAQKLVIIPMTLATGFSLSLVPNITKAFVENKYNAFTNHLNQAIQILLFLTFPAVVGMSLLAKPVYSAFYGYDKLGIEVLQTYAPAAILFALFSISAAVLQGINQQRFTILSLMIGILLKLSLNIPLIHLFETKGSIYATSIGYLAASLINLYVIYYFTGYRYSLVIRRTVLMAVLTLFMAVSVILVHSVLDVFMNTESRIQSLIVIALCAGIGAVVYFLLSLKTKLAQKLLGARIDRLKQKLGLRG
ncbi:putative polysaccharide biosynthesis protein [Peribacillus deserti]|uniref:Cell division protein n=1 Tax=Peribacillus deserti TaxID=673318 RepID=A0A2N5M4D7_9BACI|nr:polysaccharide biosynthesis protein [Peribacillus deserti]PLT29236.1 cell division protein [Peribacillus deserti]